MNSLVESMKGLSKYRLGGDGTVYVLHKKAIFEKQATVEINGLRIKFGGKYKLIKTDDGLVLKITLKVKNLQNSINKLDDWTIKAYDAKGIRLKDYYGIWLSDELAVDNNVELLPGSTLSQNLYLRYKTPYVVAVIVLESEYNNEEEYITLFLAENGSIFDLLQKRRFAKDEKEEEAVIRNYVKDKCGEPKTEEARQAFEESVQELKKIKV